MALFLVGKGFGLREDRGGGTGEGVTRREDVFVFFFLPLVVFALLAAPGGGGVMDMDMDMDAGLLG